jgi:hypothetical protein
MDKEGVKLGDIEIGGDAGSVSLAGRSSQEGQDHQGDILEDVGNSRLTI